MNQRYKSLASAAMSKSEVAVAIDGQSSKNQENIRVVVRCRPMSESEVEQSHSNIVEIEGATGAIAIRNAKSSAENKREFTFDSVYDWNSKQIDVYLETIHPIVESVLQGYNGTIFAYGQTGTGKTYTMQGVTTDSELRGVIPNCFDFIFSHISKTENLQFLVRASYMEIYQDEVKDLLSKDQKKRLELRERPDTGVYVQDLSSFVTKSVKEIVHVMNVGNQNRSVGRTDMNEHSSRSHAIFVITVECSEIDTEGESHIRVGKLNLVDLAGSERQAKTHSTGDRFKEATKINLSLSALGNVISALVDGSVTHIPYRDSKLTRLLQDSLGGNSKTVMVATIGPASYNFEETLLTLRYANRAKNIKNKPRINEDPKDALLREFQEELSRLKSMMDKRKKHFRERNKEGEGESDTDREDKDHETYLKEKRHRLESEKADLLQNTEMVEEEKDRMVQEVQKKVEEVKKEQKNRDNLAAKIKAMESKLLAGGKTISVHTAEQEKALSERRRQISLQKAREQEIKQKLEANKESASEIKETYDSLQEEVDNKTRKLKKLYHQLQLTKAEIEDHTSEQVRHKQDLLSTQEMLMKEIKFKNLVLENFVPPQTREKLCSRAEYDEDKEEWFLKGISRDFDVKNLRPRPGSALGFKRPYTAYARRMAAATGDPRYKICNIISLELDMPTRTTRDYQEPSVDPAVQALMDQVKREEEEELIVDCTMTSNKPSKIDYTKLSKQKQTNPSDNSGSSNKEVLYPSTRGLIPNSVRYV